MRHVLQEHRGRSLSISVACAVGGEVYRLSMVAEELDIAGDVEEDAVSIELKMGASVDICEKARKSHRCSNRPEMSSTALLLTT